MARTAQAESAPRQGMRTPPQSSLIPFTAAAHEHTEPAFDVTLTPGTSQVSLGPYEVPAYGYLRSIVILVTGSGGALGGGALDEDYPFNILSSIALNDVNGAPIFGPLDGYATFLSNLFGAYSGISDPRKDPGYVGTINTSFLLRIPVEISHHDGLGSLANQNAASSYKVNLSVAALSELITGGAPTAPEIRIRGYLEAWSLPNEVDLAGRPQNQAPPMHGTTQYWSQNQKSISAGENTTKLERMGNLIRNVIVVARTAAGARSATVFPDPFRFTWDARNLLNEPQYYRKKVMRERLIEPTDIPTGVFTLGFGHSVDNLAGDDAPTLWLPTVQATRMEIVGSSAAAGDLQVITNDIAPAEVVPGERFVETSRTGFQPV